MPEDRGKNRHGNRNVKHDLRPPISGIKIQISDENIILVLTTRNSAKLSVTLAKVRDNFRPWEKIAMETGMLSTIYVRLFPVLK